MILIFPNISMTLINANTQEKTLRMYICLCKAVTDTQIREAVSKGATSFGQVRKELGLASQCGKCGILAREVFDQSVQSEIDSTQLFYAVG